MRPRGTLACLAIAAVLGGGLGACSNQTPQATPAPDIPIQIGKEKRFVPEGSTLGETLTLFKLRAKPGNLLDVDGEVLEKGTNPGKMLVNGERATRATVIQPKDKIKLVDGKDETESLQKTKERISEKQAQNPQYTLGRAPGTQITTVGEVSGKPVSIVFRPSHKANVPNEVALTFDDGPNPPYTNQILKTLKRFHVDATFFVIGYLVDRHPGLVKKTERAGHAVQNHSWDHPLNPPLAELDQRLVEGQLERTSDALDKVGITPTLFRPPGGSYDGTVVQVAHGMGMRTVIWTVDPHDYFDETSKDEIVKRVLNQVRPGSIVLLHDGGGNQSSTVKALPEIIKGIRKKGLDLKPMGAAG
ncbi:MAG: polysaccharide deacetylase family protein [Actinomycetota bacterium]